MKRIILLIFLFGCSSGKTLYEEVLTYHSLSKEQKRIDGKVVKEKFTVDKKTGLKHGFYERYNLNFLTLEKGNYKNGKKSGMWKIWEETDQIIIEKDYDNNGKETPLIEKGYLKYPMFLVEERDTLPQGLLKMKLEFNNECNLIDLKILEGIDEEFNSKISNEYKRYVRLCKKYDIMIEECMGIRDTLQINFEL